MSFIYFPLSSTHDMNNTVLEKATIIKYKSSFICIYMYTVYIHTSPVVECRARRLQGFSPSTTEPGCRELVFSRKQLPVP